MLVDLCFMWGISVSPGVVADALVRFNRNCLGLSICHAVNSPNATQDFSLPRAFYSTWLIYVVSCGLTGESFGVRNLRVVFLGARDACYTWLIRCRKHSSEYLYRNIYSFNAVLALGHQNAPGCIGRDEEFVCWFI